MNQRPLGRTGFTISPIGLGCWPITGMTTLNVDQEEALATLSTAFDLGINFFDTAYAYGARGESERMIRQVLGPRRDDLVLATKGGIHFVDGKQVRDGSPARLRFECEESLRRLGTDRVELYYLHAPDPHTPLSESAAAIAELKREGKILAAGVSNVTLPELEEFHSICPLDACQPAYNMLDRSIEADLVPWCISHGVSLVVYWPLMKGLLAGHLPRRHFFQPGDGRAKYPMFQGEEWEKNQDLVDRLREIAASCGRTVAQVVLNWTIHQPGITCALAGARRPSQVHDNAGALGWQFTAQESHALNQALLSRGTPIVRTAVKRG
jgi:aryl-alcohol dehydrogenase-like predicted oxidoreductase